MGQAAAIADRGAWRWLKEAAAPRWTVVFFLLTAIGALAAGPGGQSATNWMLLPLGLLVINLAAAIVVHPRFRLDLPLLLLHLALLALVALFAWARLSYFDARTSLTQGDRFSGRFERSESGPLHRGLPAAMQFRNDGFVADYDAAGNYRGTYNQINWIGEDGVQREALIGDDRPVTIAGYRIFATFHRGLSPLFRWTPTAGVPEIGTVQLADHRERELPPTVNWTLPAGPEIWLQLDHAPIAKPAGRPQADLDAASLDHWLIVRSGDSRWEIRPGDSIRFAEGELTYLELQSWMSYRIVYDPATPWILASVLVAVASLAWYYRRRWPSAVEGT